MPDVYIKHIEQTLEMSADVYKPHVAVRHGEYEGEEYTIEIRERELPEGTPPSKPVDINIIEWDEAFYLEWDSDGGLVEHYSIVVRNSSGDIVSEIEDLTDEFIEYEDLPGTFPQNEEEYSFVITSNFFTESLSADPVLGTGNGKVPQNLVGSDGTSISISLSWDVVSGDVLYYKIYITTEEVSRVVIAETTDKVVEELQASVEHEFQVTAVSLKELFESEESNTITYTPSIIPQDFSILIEEETTEINNIICSWSGVGSVDGYNVYLSSNEGPFEKQNSELITDIEYIIEDIPDGLYEAYCTAVRGDLESDPSNVESFSVDVTIIQTEKGDNTITGSIQTFSQTIQPDVDIMPIRIGMILASEDFAFREVRLYLHPSSGGTPDLNNPLYESDLITVTDEGWYYSNSIENVTLDRDQQYYITVRAERERLVVWHTTDAASIMREGMHFASGSWWPGGTWWDDPYLAIYLEY